MPQKVTALLVSFLWMGLSMSISQTEPSHPPYHLRSVSQVLTGQINEKADLGYVLLIGHIIEKVDDDTYLFTDGTGKVKLEDDSALPIGPTLVIGGRVEQPFLGMGEVEVDVERWRFLHGSKAGTAAQ